MDYECAVCEWSEQIYAVLHIKILWKIWFPIDLIRTNIREWISERIPSYNMFVEIFTINIQIHMTEAYILLIPSILFDHLMKNKCIVHPYWSVYESKPVVPHKDIQLIDYS